MTFELRPYQHNALRRVHMALRTQRSTLLVLPTGCGKTIVFCEVIKDFVRRGHRALVLAHRGELLDQAVAKLIQAGMSDVAIEKGRRRTDGEAVVVASVQTMRGRRLQEFKPDAFGLIVADESHHVVSKGFRAILDYFAPAKVLGVTATPDRLDGKALGSVFETLAYDYSIQQAIRDGYLVPIRSQRVRVEGLDLRRVRTTAGDLNPRDLAEVLTAEKNLHEVAAPLVELAGTRKTVVFTVDVAHTEALAEVINRYRPGAAQWLSGRVSDGRRRDVLDAFRRGEFQFLANCALLTEGWDEPDLSCVAVARPTKSRALYAQMVGRGTRLYPHKRDLLVLDFVGNASNHRLISTTDVLAGEVVEDDDVAHAAELLAGVDSDLDDLDILDMAETFLAADRARDRARVKVTAVAHFLVQEVNPFLPVASPSDEPWAKNPASSKQLAILERNGLTPPDNLSAGDASAIIGAIIDRRERGLCTFKQVRFLHRHGYKNTALLSKYEASKTISRVIRGLRTSPRRRVAT